MLDLRLNYEPNCRSVCRPTRLMRFMGEAPENRNAMLNRQ